MVCERCGGDLAPIRNASGWPDLFLVRGDRLIVAELKRDGEQPTPAQRGWLEALKAVRHILVGVWRPRDVDDVTKVLR